MICDACRDRRHGECPGGSWCDCQHLPPAGPGTAGPGTAGPGTAGPGTAGPGTAGDAEAAESAEGPAGGATEPAVNWLRQG